MKEGIVVCSVSPEEYVIRRAYLNQITIPAAPKGGFSSVMIEGATDAKVFWQSLSEKEVVPFDVPAKDIVADIFQSEQLENKGCFALPADRAAPTEKELATARKKRHAQLLQWATEGDRLYSQFGTRGIQHIPDFCKRAVIELKEDRDWVFSPNVEKTECPVCGDMLKNLSNGKPPAICKGCGSILDPERVAMHAPKETPKNKGGRPKKQAEPETVSV